jgi:hypothetical protein
MTASSSKHPQLPNYSMTTQSDNFGVKPYVFSVKEFIEMVKYFVDGLIDNENPR